MASHSSNNQSAPYLPSFGHITIFVFHLISIAQHKGRQRNRLRKSGHLGARDRGFDAPTLPHPQLTMGKSYFKQDALEANMTKLFIMQAPSLNSCPYGPGHHLCLLPQLTRHHAYIPSRFQRLLETAQRRGNHWHRPHKALLLCRHPLAGVF